MIPGGFLTTRNLWSDNAAHVPAAGSREMLNSWLVALPDMWFRPDFTCPVTAFIRTLVYRIDSSSVVKRDGGWSPRVHAVATPLVAKVAKEMSRDCLRRCDISVATQV
jgi:hypothetical protein